MCGARGALGNEQVGTAATSAAASAAAISALRPILRARLTSRASLEAVSLALDVGSCLEGGLPEERRGIQSEILSMIGAQALDGCNDKRQFPNLTVSLFFQADSPSSLIALDEVRTERPLAPASWLAACLGHKRTRYLATSPMAMRLSYEALAVHTSGGHQAQSAERHLCCNASPWESLASCCSPAGMSHQSRLREWSPDGCQVPGHGIARPPHQEHHSLTTPAAAGSTLEMK